jgi:16S rRNA (cytosine1402-N4)-methyltransferase
MEKAHKPVLLSEAIGALQVGKGAHLNNLFIDATVGFGGHTKEIVKKGGRVLGIDADEEALKVARRVLKQACPATFQQTERGGFKLVHGNFRNIDEIAQKNGFSRVDGILFDLGVSSPQLTSSSRGFSFQSELSPLDMRIDRSSQKVTAADLLNTLSKKQLVQVFSAVLSLGKSRNLATKVVGQRQEAKIETVGDFLKALNLLGKRRGKLIHPATLPFLAVRMAVNSELENLSEALPKAFELLVGGGRLAVISFHSGEDAVVKNYFRGVCRRERAKPINKKPIVPKENEVQKNPRARSAKMRVLEKI